MVGRIPDETIQEIRDRTDIVGLIGRYVDLKQAGRNHKGRCPFHDEKTPSFNVNPDRQTFYCFGCQVGGSAITFLMRHENLTFPEATRSLAQECGVVIPERDSGEKGVSERLFAANEIAQEFYRAALEASAGEPARAYLAERGLDADDCAHFGIGFAPDSWDALGNALKKKGVTEKSAIQAGLSVERESKSGRDGRGSYDRQRGRVVFAIRDARGRIIGFGGRAIFEDQQPKYINTPEGPIFHKSSALYGFPQALESIRRANRVIVCEGYFDRIALERAGLGESLATCGTALTAGHGKEISRRAKEAVLLFDGDEAGQNAVEKALEVLLPIGLRVRAALLPAGDDPDSYLARHGAEALRSLVSRAPDALEQMIQRALKRGCASPSEKSAVVNHIAPKVALISDPIERSEYARRLAMVVDVDPAAVETLVRRALAGSKASSRSAEVSIETPPKNLAGAPRLPGREERHLQQLAQVTHRNPGLLSEDVRRQIEALVPEGSWKSILRLLAEAADEGALDRDGAVDLFHIESRLDGEAAARVHALSVDDLGDESETPPVAMLADLLGWFAKRQMQAEKEQLTRQLHDPSADHDALLIEKQRQLEERRAAHRRNNPTIQ